jgi:hypothetical protein
MELLFTCLRRQIDFFSADYEICDHRGVATDAAGNRYLDARIKLASPCPCCGEIHEYPVSDLACPLTAANSD